MGVYHLSGMGFSPGAVTVPLTYVYLFLKAANLGNEEAKNFFATSGEQEQENKGAPECLILFTSSEVITGEKKDNIRIKDDWFKSRQEFPKAMWRYFSNLWRELEDDKFRPFYNGEWIRKIYFVEVDVTNFEDCFKKVGTTLYALREKELWINMIGGTNQVNIALLLAGTFYAVSVRYYYIFQGLKKYQEEIQFLHPATEKPNMRDPTPFVKNALSKWHELPVFQLTHGRLLNTLITRFKQGDMREEELNRMLEENGFTRQYIPKLRGQLIIMKGKKVLPGPMLERIEKLNKLVDNVENFSKWKEWAIEKRILWEMKNGRLERVQ